MICLNGGAGRNNRPSQRSRSLPHRPSRVARREMHQLLFEFCKVIRVTPNLPAIHQPVLSLAAVAPVARGAVGASADASGTTPSVPWGNGPARARPGTRWCGSGRRSGRRVRHGQFRQWRVALSPASNYEPAIERSQGFLERLTRECWLRLGRGVVASVREELQGAGANTARAPAASTSWRSAARRFPPRSCTSHHHRQPPQPFPIRAPTGTPPIVQCPNRGCL